MKRERKAGGNGGVSFDFPFLFLFFTHIIASNHSHCTRLFLCSILRPFCEQWKIKIRTRRLEERNAVIGQESLRRFVKDQFRSPFNYIVSIFDATNWKFSAGQSSIIQHYWTATDAFHLLFSVPLEYCLIVLYYRTGTTDTDLISSNCRIRVTLRNILWN